MHAQLTSMCDSEKMLDLNKHQN